MNHLQSVQSFVQNDMQWVCQAHDRYHIERVCTIATHITQSYNDADKIVVQYWALLHEYFDDKFFESHQLEWRKNILEEFLSNLNISTQQKESICFIAKNVGYWKSKARDPELLLPIEFKIVEDADRLEAVWAIAIARCFAYWWAKWRSIYDPNELSRDEITRENYRIWSGTAINHFYEKLLLLKDLMHTPEAKKIAEKRHAFMEQYLQEFFKERNCQF